MISPIKVKHLSNQNGTVQTDLMDQALQAATINAQLTALPIFSYNVRVDKLTAKQWFEKVIMQETGHMLILSHTSEIQ